MTKSLDFTKTDPSKLNTRPTKIAVVGAAGPVGRSLLPLLVARGAELLLIGGDTRRIGELYAGLQTCSEEQAGNAAAGFDIILHLPLNDPAACSHSSLECQQHVAEVDAKARMAGIVRAIIVAPADKIDVLNGEDITQSDDSQFSREVGGGKVTIVYLPSIRSNYHTGKLAILNKLPRSLARLAFPVFASFHPTVHASSLADFILGPERAGGKNLILSEGQDENWLYRSVRRMVDLAFAVTVLIFGWWLLLAIWGVIKLQSPGPGIFAQQRVGRNEVSFTCYKFRTMKEGTVQAGTHQISSQAVTRIGSFLRRTKLDELPQIINILRNEISLIGPRPCLPVQGQLLEARRRRGVFKLKPGITGLAQVLGIDMSDPDRLAEVDAQYSALQSLKLDFRIAIATALGGGHGDRVR